MSAMAEPFSLTDSALDLFVGCLNEKSLHDLAERELGPKAIARLDDLAEKANEGTLTADERSEYRSFIELSEFLALAQLRARERLGLPLAG
jgi:hypothetical protein